jgi:hypothetical protein
MSLSDANKGKNRTRVYNLTLAAVAGQVGCLTLIIILAALFGGLWLDSHFDTKPTITIILMIISVPVTLVMMFWVVKATTSRIQSVSKKQQEQMEDAISGK